MSTLAVPTRYLVGTLQDLVRTAGTDPLVPELGAVLLFTDRGAVPVEDGDGPGGSVPSDVLVGWSTDGTVAAQAHTACTGRWHEPVLVSAASAVAVVDCFKQFTKGSRAGPHEVVLEYSGGVLRVSEDPAVSTTPMVLVVDVMVDELDAFPDVGRVLAPARGEVRQNGLVVAPTYGVGLDAAHLAVIAAVAKRRKMRPVLYTDHQSRPVVVGVGAWYRAGLVPVSDGVGDVELGGPVVPVFTPNQHR